MTYIEAPDEFRLAIRRVTTEPSVFLAGGITGCPDWQAEARKLLEPHFAVLNPRRADFPIGDRSAGRAQIEWEFRHLALANVILFWFPGYCKHADGSATQTPDQPIALYELGRWAALQRHIGPPPARVFVGVQSGYSREVDVRVQLELARPDIKVRSTLADVCNDALELVRS